VWYLDRASLIEKLGSSRVHAVLDKPSMELVLLTTRASKVLSILSSYSQSILFDLVLH